MFPSTVSTFFAERRALSILLGFSIAIFGCSSESRGAPAPGPDGATDTDARAGEAGTEASAAKGVTPAPDGKPWSTLAEWHLFTDAPKQAPEERVVPYEVNAQLFADYAQKHRFLYVPEGAHIGYQATSKWTFPVGTILVKTFSYLADARDASKGERLLETRLLVHQTDGWVPHTYVWDAEQTAATREVAGTVLQARFIDPSGNDVSNAYVVPSGSDCRQCHGKLGTTDTLGGRTRQLDRTNDYGNGPENQIDHFAGLGFFEGAPEPVATRERLADPLDTGAALDDRARAYLDSNCGHCHQPGDSAGTLSGFWVDYASTAPAESRANFGYCKQPASAGGATCGRSLDVIPGRPDLSILLCRMESTEGKVRMPPLGRNLVHAEGVALLREWVASMSGSCGPVGTPDAGGPDAAPDSGAADSGSD